MQVTVSIISEQQANTLLKNDKMAKGEASGEILNNTGTMEYQKASRQLSVSFRLVLTRSTLSIKKKTDKQKKLEAAVLSGSDLNAFHFFYFPTETCS